MIEFFALHVKCTNVEQESHGLVYFKLCTDELTSVRRLPTKFTAVQSCVACRCYIIVYQDKMYKTFYFQQGKTNFRVYFDWNLVASEINVWILLFAHGM